MQVYEFNVAGMKCNSCRQKLGDHLKQHSAEFGITHIKLVSAEKGKVLLEVDEGKFDSSKVVNAIADLGYQVKDHRSVPASELDQSNDSCCVQ